MNISMQTLGEDIDMVMDDENIMKFQSLDTFYNILKISDNGSIEHTEKVIKNLIENREPHSNIGICNCNSDFLCEHRKKYIKKWIVVYALRLIKEKNE